MNHEDLDLWPRLKKTSRAVVFNTVVLLLSLCLFLQGVNLIPQSSTIKKPHTLVLQTDLDGALQHLTLDVFIFKQVPWFLYTAALNGGLTQVRMNSLKQQISSLPSPENGYESSMLSLPQ